MPYPAFRRRVLGALAYECVAPPLRQVVETIAARGRWWDAHVVAKAKAGEASAGGAALEVEAATKAGGGTTSDVGPALQLLPVASVALLSLGAALLALVVARIRRRYSAATAAAICGETYEEAEYVAF